MPPADKFNTPPTLVKQCAKLCKGSAHHCLGEPHFCSTESNDALFVSVILQAFPICADNLMSRHVENFYSRLGRQIRPTVPAIIPIA